MDIKKFVEQHPVATYFVLAYLLAWGGIVMLIGPGGLAPSDTRPMGQVLLVFLAMLIGPSVTGITLTTLLEGKAGLQMLWGRWTHWRVEPHWYGVALLTTPILLLALLSTLSVFSSDFVPGLLASDDKLTVLGFGLVIGALAGFFEEIGWTGFAIPRLLSTRGVVATGLWVGLLWGTWHLLGDYWGNAGPYRELYIYRGLLWVLTLTAYRTLMVWVYSRTGSLVLAQMMHATFTGGQAILGPETSPAHYLLWYGMFSIVLWVFVAVIALKFRKGLAPSPLQAHSGLSPL